MRNIIRTPGDSSPPAVLHLVNSFAEGGTERQAVQLVNALNATDKWNVSIASLDARGPLRDALADNLKCGNHEYRLRGFATWQAVRQTQRFAAQLRREHVCILHTHGFYPNVFGMFAAALAGVPVRIASKRESPHLRSRSRVHLERVAFSLATRVVANCNGVRAEMDAAGWPVKKVEVIHNAIDLTRVAHDTPRDAEPGVAYHAVDQQLDVHSPPRHRIIVMLANFMHEAKDHDTMLHAAHRIARHAPDVRFVFAGEGPLLSRVQAQAREMDLLEHVAFPGCCRDVGALLAKATVCVLASRQEGFPNVILEYMVAGRPVVATDVGGVREAVLDGTTGLIVAPGDPQALAEALIRVLNDPARGRAMGLAGHERALLHFPVSRQVERITALYERELEALTAMRR